MQPAYETGGIVEAAFVDEVGSGEVAPDTEQLGLLPLVLIVSLQIEIIGQAVLGEYLANRQKNLFDLNAGAGRLGRVHRALCGGNTLVEEALAPAHHLVADPQVECVASDIPVAIGVIVEETQVVAVLVDGFVGEAVGARAPAAGKAVGGTGAVVVALIVDGVVEASGAYEHAEILAPADIGFGEETGPVLDQATSVEGIVAVVAVRIAGVVA
ncbi:hypothetical protein D3C81_1447980 [compost metagenome]